MFNLQIRVNERMVRVLQIMQAVVATAFVGQVIYKITHRF